VLSLRLHSLFFGDSALQLPGAFNTSVFYLSTLLPTTSGLPGKEADKETDTEAAWIAELNAAQHSRPKRTLCAKSIYFNPH
jgi:hypothetical protein